MSRAIHVRSISESDRKELQNLLSSENRSLAKRARIILLSAQGKTLREIAKEVGLHYQNVRKWVHRFIASGIPGLEHRGKGKSKNVKHPPDIKQRIAAIAATDPRDLRQPFDTWSLPKLKAYLIKKKIVSHISIETIRRVLIANNVDWRRGEYWLKVRGGTEQEPQGSVMVNLREGGFGNGGVTVSFDRQGYATIADGPPDSSDGFELIAEQSVKQATQIHAYYTPGSQEMRIRFYKRH